MDGLEKPLSKFGNDPAEDLLGYIAIDPKGPDGRAAGTELYARFRTRLFKILRNSWVRSVVADDDDLAGLVHEVFIRAYDTASQYTGKTETACLNWLVGIARNVVRQELTRPRSVRAELVLDEAPEPEVELVFADDVQQKAINQEVEKAYGKLSEREQDIMAVTVEWHRPGDAHQRLPDDVSAGLAERWSTTSANLRQIRKRATAKLRAELEPHLKTRGSR